MKRPSCTRGPRPAETLAFLAAPLAFACTSSSPGSGGPPDSDTEMANPAPSPGPSGLRRLTTREYRKTLGDLFGRLPLDQAFLPEGGDTRHNNFDNFAPEQA